MYNEWFIHYPIKLSFNILLQHWKFSDWTELPWSGSRKILLPIYGLPPYHKGPDNFLISSSNWSDRHTDNIQLLKAKYVDLHVRVHVHVQTKVTCHDLETIIFEFITCKNSLTSNVKETNNWKLQSKQKTLSI